jgi:hypothetical protein
MSLLISATVRQPCLQAAANLHAACSASVLLLLQLPSPVYNCSYPRESVLQKSYQQQSTCMHVHHLMQAILLLAR